MIKSELKVIEYILQKNCIVSKKEITRIMKQRYKFNKFKMIIILSKLTKKGILHKKRIYPHTYYKITITQEEYPTFKSVYLRTSLYNESFISSISTLHKQEYISDEKLDALEDWIRNLKE